ncbi:MAG TPA: DUF3014 domain-containing protein [Pseudomonadales bacterium]|nr:DUF3014 domain-containing protein [Pseudomonadales bacterium]
MSPSPIRPDRETPHQHISSEHRMRPAVPHSVLPRFMRVLMALLLLGLGLYVGVNYHDDLQHFFSADQQKPAVIAPNTMTQQAPAEVVEDATLTGQIDRLDKAGNLNAPDVLAVEAVTLPTLERSDDFFRSEWALLSADARMAEWASTDQLLRKAMTVLDNLARGKVMTSLLRSFSPAEAMPALPLPVAPEGEQVEHFRLDPSGYERFTSTVAVINGLDNTQLVGFYIKLRPLFQQAYLELGYPSGHVDDVIFKALRVINAVSVPVGEMDLIRPKVKYQFADPALEALSPLEKLFIRMGPQNSRVLQQKAASIEPLLRSQLPAR